MKALVHDWFLLQMNEEKFAQQYALNTDPASAGDWAADHGNYWCNNSKIALRQLCLLTIRINSTIFIKMICHC